jgi:ATP synthase I chain
MTNEVRQAEKEYCTQAMMLAIGAALIFLVLGDKPVSKGLILGTLFSILNFVLIAQSLPFRLDKGRGKAFFACMGSVWLRYAVLAVPLIVASKSDSFDFIAAAVGILMVQVVILGHQLVGRVFSMR